MGRMIQRCTWKVTQKSKEIREEYTVNRKSNRRRNREEIGVEGRSTYPLRSAGCVFVLLVSPTLCILMVLSDEQVATLFP